MLQSCETKYNPLDTQESQEGGGCITVLSDDDSQAYTPLTIATTAESESDMAEGFKKAIQAGDSLLVRSMIKRQADVNRTYKMGLTPLHFAAMSNHKQVVRALLYANADQTVTTDDGIQAGNLAEMEGHKEIIQILSDHPWVQNPIRRRYLGPCIITTIILSNAVVTSLLYFRPWSPSDPAAADVAPVWLEALGYTMAAVALGALAMANMLDPGTVERHAVNYVKELREMSGDTCVDIGEDGGAFGILRRDGAIDMYKWCRSCEFWKPPAVSHCAECKRCFWRFDHHCAAVGNCIGARNHRFFAMLLVSGSAAWIIGAACVGMKIAALDPEATFSERSWQDQVTIIYLVLVSMILVILTLFGLFHTGALIWNFNSKKVLRPTQKDMQYSRLNTREEFGLLFTMPYMFRPHGPSRPIPPRLYESID